MSRKSSYSGKYKLSKAEFRTAYYYALRYKEWLREYNRLKDSGGAITYSDMPHGKGGTSNPTMRLAMKRAELKTKMSIVEDTVAEAAGDLAPYLFQGVIDENVTFDTLTLKKQMPCSRNTYYKLRRKFYWLLAKKI